MLKKAITVLLIAMLLVTAFLGGMAISRAEGGAASLLCLDTGG